MLEIRTINSATSFEFVKKLVFSLYQKGDYKEAREVLTETLGAHENMPVSERVSLYILWGMVERGDGNIDAALRVHQEGRPYLENCNDKVLCAKFRNGTAGVLWLLKRYDDALEEMTAVRVLMEEARDVDGYVQAGMNIANVLVEAGNPSDAHLYLDDAERICVEEELRAQLLDIRARAFHAEGKQAEAKQSSSRSLELTIESENDKLLYEHLATFFSVSGVRLDVDKLKHAIEAVEIRNALIEAKGSVYRAAPKLNLTCEGLRQKLKYQHPDLLYLRTPPRRSPTKAS